MDFLKTLTTNFDPLTSALIILVGLFVYREFRRLSKNVLINKCKVQAIFESIDKHSPNGQAAFMRERYKSLLDESSTKEN
jgi:O-methyltransferase involved in polyketide biosynthesis